jgi:hypothetical protein
MKNTVFWDVVPCRYFVNRRFGGAYRLHLQGIRNPRAMKQRERPILPLRKYLYGATSQKTEFFIVTAVKTLNLTRLMNNSNFSYFKLDA